MYNVLCFITLLVLAVTAQKYDLEQRSNKLFEKPLSQVLQEFRGTSEYLEILTKRFSNWKKSAEIIFLALDEDQTNKFLMDVDYIMDSDEHTENFERNMKKKIKSSSELLDQHSYAKVTPDEEYKLLYLAYKHINVFLHSYMDALTGSSNSSFNDEHILNEAPEIVPQEPEVSEQEVPKEPEVSEQEVLKELEVSEQEVPKEPNVSEKEVPNEPEVSEQEVPKEPEVSEQEVPNEQEVPTQEVPKEPEVSEQEVPMEQEVPKQDILKEPEVSEQKLPKESEVPAEGEPGTTGADTGTGAQDRRRAHVTYFISEEMRPES